MVLFSNSIRFIKKHKIISAIAVLLIGGGIYFGLQRFGSETMQARYVLGTVERGTLITSVSGSGQISASNQVDVMAKAGGDVVSLAITQGQAVTAGTVLARLDASEAYKAVRDAQVNLESAQLSLEKLQQPADELSVLQAENALTQAEQNKANAQTDLIKAYDDGFSAVADVFLDLPDMMIGLQDLLFANTLSFQQYNLDAYTDAVKMYNEKVLQYRDNTNQAYQAARAAYDQNFADYKVASRFSDEQTIETLINQTYDTTKLIAEAVKSAVNLIQFYKDTLTEHDFTPNNLANTHLASLGGYTGTTNSRISSLLSIARTITSDKEAIIEADRTIAEKQGSLVELRAEADPLDVRSQELTIQQRKNSLADAQEQLANYTARAPFDGVIASVGVAVGDSISANSTIATLITNQRVAEITLNEVDVAKVAVGQKATLTFDAVEDLSISGQVAEIDIIGTVSQGVVSYTVKILFDTQDERIKPGMSVSASIITEAKPDVLLVPASAVKTQGQISYVEVFNPPLASDQGSSGVVSVTPPTQQVVEVGLSNDTSTEIISGLIEGDQIVTGTVSQNSSQATNQSAPSLFGGAGGGVRIQR